MNLINTDGMMVEPSPLEQAPSIIFGDARDGNGTFVNSAGTVLGLTAVGTNPAVYTMTKNLYCGNLTVNSSVVLKTAGYKIFCTGTLTNNGSILCEGNSSSGSGAAALPATTEFLGSGAGGNGASGAAGGAGGNSNATMRTSASTGGKGGTGAGTPPDQPSGLGGADNVRAFLLAPGIISPNSLLSASAGKKFDPFCLATGNLISGGAGGGGGGQGRLTGGVGGGGGSGGGCLAIFANTLITGAGSLISVAGGAGSSGSTGGSSGYGGGGGGGGSAGFLFLYYSNTNPSNIDPTKLKLTGGTGAAGGAGTNANGSAGNNGADGVILRYNAAYGIWE